MSFNLVVGLRFCLVREIATERDFKRNFTPLIAEVIIFLLVNMFS